MNKPMMYKYNMPLDFQNSINIKTLSVKPDLIIWYAKISRITKEVFNRDYSGSLIGDTTQIKNRTFDKNSFKQCFLNNEEVHTINGFKAFKKQIEWISGRYLVKLMIQYNFSLDLPIDQINLDYLDQGAPFLCSAPNIPLSLSHSNNYTTAACCKNKDKTVGIDIEKIDRKPDSWFLKTAFTKKEIAHLQDNAFSIFKNWTIKEAYLKYIKKGFNESLHKVEVINNEIWHNKNRVEVDIYSTIIDDNDDNDDNDNDDYVLSLVTN